MTYTFSDEIYSAFAELCKSIDSPRSLAYYLLLESGQVKDLLSMGIDPSHYLRPDSFADDYLLYSYLQKYESHDLGIDKEKVCIDGWKATELKCASVNQRFRTRDLGLNTKTHSILHVAARKISRLLGPLSPGKCFSRSEWSSGATLDLSRREAAFDNKMLSKLSVSASALKYARAYLEVDYHWFWALTGSFPDGQYCVLDDLFTIVDHARATTVPKSYKTDRFISIEPTMNVFLQKGVGSFIRRKLRSVGVDLDDQSVNQTLAAKAVSDHLATVDLRSASDSISIEVVFSLLPLEWALFLDDLRSKQVKLNGSTVRLEKFSSMGNGFTFELESLIFWAISSSVEETFDSYGVTSVYGDDIIIPSRCYDVLVAVLEDVGFEVNTDKSYSTGLFYESCGKHFFDAVDVTPVYQKRSIPRSGKPRIAESIRAYNRLVRWSQRVKRSWRHRVVRRALDIFFKVNNGHRLFLPLGAVGDGGYLVPHSHFHSHDRNHGYYCRELVWTEKERLSEHRAALSTYLRRTLKSPSVSDGQTNDCLAFVRIGGGRYVYRNRWVFDSAVSLCS